MEILASWGPGRNGWASAEASAGDEKIGMTRPPTRVLDRRLKTGMLEVGRASGGSKGVNRKLKVFSRKLLANGRRIREIVMVMVMVVVIVIVQY